MRFKTAVKVIVDNSNSSTIFIDWSIGYEENDEGIIKMFPIIHGYIDLPEKPSITKIKIKEYAFIDTIALRLESPAYYDSKTKIMNLIFNSKPL